MATRDLTWYKTDKKEYCVIYPFTAEIYQSDDYAKEHALHVNMQTKYNDTMLDRRTATDINLLKQLAVSILVKYKNEWIDECIKTHARLCISEKFIEDTAQKEIDLNEERQQE